MVGLIEERSRTLARLIVRSAREPRDRVISNGYRGLLEALADGRTRLGFDDDRWDPRERARAKGDLDVASITHLWNRHRHHYVVHPQLVSELKGVRSTKIPGQTWQHLPHSEPLIITPAAPTVVTADERDGRLGGFFVHGRRRDGALCSVHDTARTSIGLAFFIRIGRHQFDVVRTTIDTTASQTVEQMVTAALGRFEAGDGPPPSDPRWATYLHGLLDLAIPLLLYACTDPRDRDLRPLPLPAGRTRAHRTRGESMQALGWRLGPNLYSARLRAATATPIHTEGGGWRQPFHQRACSLRTYWTGPGKQTPVLKLVLPYLVSQDLIGDPDDRPARVFGLR